MNYFKHIKCFFVTFGTLNTTPQVLEMIMMINEQIQTYQMVFMNFWYIKHYGARVQDDFVAKNN